MSAPVRFEGVDSPVFGGLPRASQDFARARVVVLPIPLDRTTSYVAGTRNGPREILVASSHMELYDEEVGGEPVDVGLYTLPEMELPFEDLADVMAEVERVSGELFDLGKFPFVLGGEHSITPAIVAAAARRHPGLTVLQLDAHADLRDRFMGTRFNHACAMRRTLEHARCVQVAVRSLAADEARAIPTLNTTVFYDLDMRTNPAWIDRVVDALADPVYVTIDCDALDPAIMPAVGTPEPGGLQARELLKGIRRLATELPVVSMEVVEVSPPYDSADITALLAHRVILEALSGIALRRSGRSPTREPSN